MALTFSSNRYGKFLLPRWVLLKVCPLVCIYFISIEKIKTQTNFMFELSEACERNSKELNDKLTCSLVLTLPEVTKRFVVHCDASWVCLGCIHMKHFKMIAYASIQLMVKEKNYLIHDFEIEVAVLGLWIQMHHLHRVDVNLCNNHKRLQNIFNQKVFNLRQMRWFKLLKYYGTVSYTTQAMQILLSIFMSYDDSYCVSCWRR